MGADWWKPRNNRACITRYKHGDFCACRVDFTGILNKQNRSKYGWFRIKHINKRRL